MGLDNGCYVCSNHRKITRDMLPEELEYPFSEDYYDGKIEVLYWRKYWGLRNEVVRTFPQGEDKYHYIIDTPSQVFKLIRIIVSFMNKEKWDEEDSVWDYEEVLPRFQRDVMNLAIVAAFMKNNPDVYLEFYDSY